jgi:hypothetical protein
VIAINEQTWYRTPANSHTARQGADELLFVHLTGDSSRYAHAIRQLIWSTYMVDVDGKNRFPTDDVWLTDGYGDYVRHFIRAMAVAPELAPAGENHILSSSSVVQQADYHARENKILRKNEEGLPYRKICLRYRTYDIQGQEILTLSRKPSGILLDNKPLVESSAEEGYTWKALRSGGVLIINRKNGNDIQIIE